jgi:phage protein D
MATQTTPIYQGQDFYVPYFQIKVGSNTLDQKVIHDILRVTYKDSLTEVDSFEFTLNNWDETKPGFDQVRGRSFKYSDEHRFDPGQTVELWMGYFGQDRLRLMLRGEITSLRPAFPASGPSTLVVSGLNSLHRLRGQQRTEAYVKMTDSEMAARIAQQLGLRLKPGPGGAPNETRHDYVLQDNQFDLIFLLERARRIGYDVFIEEKGQRGQSEPSTLYFGPSDAVKRVTYELVYGASLIQFTPNLSTANQVGKVTVRGWDRRTKKPITYTATRQEIQTKGVGAQGGQSALEQSFYNREEVIADQPVETEAEAKALAVRTLENISKDMVKGSGSTVGLPDLRSGCVLTIGGLGKRFSGHYFVTATTHTIDDSGYQTQFECRREEV